MILFPHTRTRRISVRLTELSLGEGIALAGLPAARHELTTTELLRFVARAAEKPRETFVTDPLAWTVQERTFLLCTYLAHVTSDGPDFGVGTEAHLSDYIDFNRDFKSDEVDLGEVAGHPRVMRPLLGVHAQALEMICKYRGDWVIGAIACSVFVKDSPEAAVNLLEMSDIAVQEWIETRMTMIKALPESMFEEVYVAYYRGVDELAHFFDMDFDDDGVLFDARREEGAAQKPQGRFFASSCISELSRSLSKRLD